MTAAVLLAFALGTSVALAEPPVGRTYVIRTASLAPEGYVWTKYVRRTFEAITARTGGQVRLELHAGGVMGDEPEMIQKLEAGEIDAVGVTFNGANRMDPALAVLGLPFLFDSDSEYSYVANSLLQFFHQRLLKQGYYMLALIFQGGGAQLFSTQPPTSLRELVSTGVFWTWKGDRTLEVWFEAMRVTKTVQSEVPEALALLQDGRVSVFSTTAIPMVALGWFPYVRTVYMVDAAYLMGVVVITRRVWDRLSADLRRVMDEEWEKAVPGFNKAILRDEEIALLGMLKRKVTIVHPMPEEMTWLKERSLTMWKKLEGTFFPPELLDRVLQLRDEYRRLNPKP
ncbi:MAG: TRAP transporter substrate-binding protein DctP [Nitrospirae bacterium]|nr:TRAP transporter substrate-binding protein DctP [Nitrospirota bacterium]